MEIYLVPIKSAFVAFPFIALLFTLPYIVTQYKRFGAIPFWRSAIMYTFILYLINMYFFVILPLPPAEEVANYTGPAMQLIPFQFVSDFIKKSNFNITDPGTYWAAVTDSTFFVVLFNMLLFVPLGIYLCYYFKWSWKKTLAASFGVSLFFELTQLSGLYGIYPRPYRLFDVDDLMLNTLGGMEGYWMTPVICHFLPSRERIDEMAYEKGERVPLLRRFLALVLDWITLFFFAGVLRVGLHVLENLLPAVMGRALEWIFSGAVGAAVLLTLYFGVLPWATGGYTFGKWFFRMKITDEEGGEPKFYQYLVRYGILYCLIIFGPFLVIGCFYLAAVVPTLLSILLALLVLFVGGIWLLFLWESLLQLFGRRQDYFYGRFSRTRDKNMIVPRKRRGEKRRKTDDHTAGDGKAAEGETAGDSEANMDAAGDSGAEGAESADAAGDRKGENVDAAGSGGTAAGGAEPADAAGGSFGFAGGAGAGAGHGDRTGPLKAKEADGEHWE